MHAVLQARLVVLCLAAAVAVPAHAAEYEFSIVPGNGTGVYVSTINNQGEILFDRLGLDTGPQLVLVDRKDAVHVVAEVTDLSMSSPPHLSNNGVVTFLAAPTSTNGVGRTLYRADRNGVRVLADDVLRFTANDIGDVVFLRWAPEQGHHQLYSLFKGDPETNTGLTTRFPSWLRMNNRQQVVFSVDGAPEAAGPSLASWDGREASIVAPHSFLVDGVPHVVSLRDPALTENGTVVFLGNSATGTGSGIFRTSGDGIETVMYEGAGSGFYNAAVNERGSIHFQGTVAGEAGSSIYSGQNPATDRVIGPGDALFGSRVQRVLVNFAARWLNSPGELVFNVWLEDGRRVLVRASPRHHAH